MNGRTSLLPRPSAGQTGASLGCPGCSGPVESGQISCRPCWHRAPIDVRLILHAARRHTDPYVAVDAAGLLDEIQRWLRRNPTNDLHHP